MKITFLCRPERIKSPAYAARTLPYPHYSSRDRLNAYLQDCLFINLNNSTFMRMLTHAVQKKPAPKILLLVFFLAVGFIAGAQQKTITGTVKNAEDGSLLANATVIVKGTVTGTTTNERESIQSRQVLDK